MFEGGNWIDVSAMVSHGAPSWWEEQFRPFANLESHRPCSIRSKRQVRMWTASLNH